LHQLVGTFTQESALHPPHEGREDLRVDRRAL
jgi:hypothetical protein